MKRLGPFLLMLVGGACVPASQDDDPEARRFFTQHISRHQTSIRQYSVERQLDIYEYGLRHLHPPPTYLSTGIATSGASVVPPVVRRLRRKPDDMIVWSYLLVLADLGCDQGQRPLEDSVTAAVVRAAVARIKSPVERAGAERSVRRMRGDCAPSRTFSR